MICPTAKGNYFCGRDWTGGIALKCLAKIAVCGNALGGAGRRNNRSGFVCATPQMATNDLRHTQ
jgi:hypothetical protein